MLRFSQARCVAKSSQHIMVSIQKAFALTHFRFHRRAKMIDNLIVEFLDYYTAVIEVLNYIVYMLAVKALHD